MLKRRSRGTPAAASGRSLCPRVDASNGWTPARRWAFDECRACPIHRNVRSDNLFGGVREIIIRGRPMAGLPASWQINLMRDQSARLPISLLYPVFLPAFPR